MNKMKYKYGRINFYEDQWLNRMQFDERFDYILSNWSRKYIFGGPVPALKFSDDKCGDRKFDL